MAPQSRWFDRGSDYAAKKNVPSVSNSLLLFQASKRLDILTDHVTHPYHSEVIALRQALSNIILGKEAVVEDVLTTLIAGGHLLIEDVPGVGKTTLAVALARSIGGSFQRIQFTSDLLPSDVLGVTIFNATKQAFEFKPGPIFANIVLADEINRTTPKTQSALLEAMQEGSVTVERETHRLPQPFMVIATQNPIEFHGTYPLPESQLDRFLMRITMGYPEAEAELRILKTRGASLHLPEIKPVLDEGKVLKLQQASTEVRVDESISKYMVTIIGQTRKNRDLELGVSPRGALGLYRAIQSRAFIQGRTFATPDDVKQLAMPVLAHRMIVSGRRAASSTSSDTRTMSELVLREILAGVEVPV